MQIESIAANVRLRSSWESIDLGFTMVRTWWHIIYTPLAVLLLALIALFFLVIPYEYYWVTLLLLWWLKPLYHRLILHIISHRLFGETLSVSAALKTLPHLMLKTGLLSELTWRRLSFSRGFRLPIWQLENLRGAARKQRQQVLLGTMHSDAVWLTIAIFCFQIILTLSFFMLIWLFIPAHYSGDLLSGILSNQLGDIGYSFEIIAVTGLVVVMVFLEPFYIGASFALYINRRTQLEAWDIELDFRKMSQRMQAADKKLNALPSLLIVCALMMAGAVNRPAVADTVDDTAIEQSVNLSDDFVAEQRLPAHESARVIKEVMTSDALSNAKKVMGWRYIDRDKETPKDLELPEWLQSLAAFIAKIFEFSLWIIIAAAIIALYWFRQYWLPILEGKSKTVQADQPDILFGMDVRSDSLPTDILASSQALWQKGQAREALSLLYRSALVTLINQEQLALKQNHTEGDILKLSQTELSATRQHYFKSLTKHWVQIAYAHTAPSEADMQYLLQHWESDFTQTDPENIT